MKKIRNILIAIVAAVALMIGFAGTASATSLSGLGAPPVDNTHCWERQGFGFTEVNCQWGTPYNYASQLYHNWIVTGQVKLYGSNWPTAAAQPNNSTAYHQDWSSGFVWINTTTWDAYNWSIVYYNPFSNVIGVCNPNHVCVP